MSAEHCYHCGLSLAPDASFQADIAGDIKSFCCHGCLSVCEAIHQAGLQSFYQKTADQKQLKPPPEIKEHFDDFDQDEIQVAYVTRKGLEKTVQLLIEGISCSACVWLIEHAMSKLEGIVSAEVNLTSRILKVTWKSDRIALSAILERLKQLGYSATPYDLEQADFDSAKRHRDLLYRMAFAGFAMMNMLWVTIALYSGADDGEFRSWFYWVSFIIATPAFLYSGFPFLRNAITGLKHRHMTMDLPIAIGATVTYSYSSYVLLFDIAGGQVYFDTVVNFLFVILVGRYLEALSKKNALSSTHRLLALQPKLATLMQGKDTKTVPIKVIKKGDKVLVKPGQTVPVDGYIIEGQSAVDESMLTGESKPVSKSEGDKLSAGTLNTDGAFVVVVEEVLRNTALAKIIDLMQDAQASKAPIQQLADKIVPWFVLATLVLSVSTFLYWNQYDFNQALLAATSVLIITCPCAFGLATPMSVAVATGVGAKNGILVRHGAVLERLSSATEIVFDKTATLTEGKLSLRSIETLGDISEITVLQVAASVERQSEHAIGQAIVDEALKRQVAIESITAFKAFAGQGVSAYYSADKVCIGTRVWLESQGVDFAECDARPSMSEQSSTESHIYLAINGVLHAIFAIHDDLRVDAQATIKELQKKGLKTSIISGDNGKVVKAISEQLGSIPYKASVLPAEKVSYIRDLQKQSKRVVMVGDGVNDAPALTQADIGVAMASGTDVSIDCADIVLMHDELSKVLSAQYLADMTLRTIRQNIAISISYNIVMVPLAVMGLITPLMAAVTMPISSLLVVGNAARINRLFKA